MTKQLKSVTLRPAAAPATSRPAGRNLKPSIAAPNRPAQSSASRSGAAKAVATRRHVSSMVLSRAVPSGALSRYFMSQICWAIDATVGTESPLA